MATLPMLGARTEGAVKHRWRQSGRKAANAVAGLFGLRFVSASWGPRGAFDTLARIRSRGFSPALIFDVGASNGQWTRECRTLYPSAKYLLIDPLEQNRRALQDLAGTFPQIAVFHGAAGAAAGTIEIFDHGDQSSVLQSADFPGPKRSVEVTTIDELFAAHGAPPPVLLKADVQGYELEVLRGASRCLDATEVLLLEVSFRRMYEDSALAHEIISYVGERGFRMYDICSYLQRPADKDLVQSDVVFVHESSPLFRHQGWGAPE